MASAFSSPRATRRALAWWLPYRFAGIRVLHIAEDWSSVRVRLRLSRFNRTVLGAHFGGSLYAMSDPFWAMLLMKGLGSGYVVWDKRADIEFVSPGRGDVFADFVLAPGVLQEIRDTTADGSKALPWFASTVVAADGTLVARVHKQLYVRRKRDDQPSTN